MPYTKLNRTIVMDFQIRLKADLERRFVFFLFSSSALIFGWSLVISLVLTVIFRKREPYAHMDFMDFREWRVPHEMAAFTVIWPISMAFLIAYMYVYTHTICGVHKFLLTSPASLPSSRLTADLLASLTFPSFLCRTSNYNWQIETGSRKQRLPQIQYKRTTKTPS